MPQTKLIYGVGRTPKASEFALGEVIVNVDDSKVYSKNKSNVVFEIGQGGGGGSVLAYSTASAYGSGIITADSTNTLIVSGGSGITVTTGTNNDLIISATGGVPDADWYVDAFNSRLTSSLDIFVDGNITGSNISANGYLNMGPLGAGTYLIPKAGDLMYSASNEFYLGFS